MSKAQPATRRSAKREAILDAALSAFLEVGYAATSMDGVAARAMVSKATIYAHFESKEQLFGAVIRRRCEQSAAFAPNRADQDARTTLTQLGRRVLDLLVEPGSLAMYRVVVAESVRHPDLARAFYDSGPGNGKAQMAQQIADLARKGELTVADPWDAADMFVGLLRTDWFMRTLLGLPQPDGRTLEGVVERSVEAMLKIFGKR
jgi:TetR/AcrR family transcriptional repressor of mexJK operon